MDESEMEKGIGEAAKAHKVKLSLCVIVSIVHFLSAVVTSRQDAGGR